MDRPPGREPGRRPRERPDPAGGRRRVRDPLPRPRHRGDVPDERAVPRDRGIVPALRDPLPARRRDPVLRPARGQGRAGLPADPALRHRQRELRADHQRARAEHRREDDRSRSVRWRVARAATYWGAIEAAARGEAELAPRTRNALSEFAALVRRLRTRVGVLPLPELLDDALEASGYRAMLADGSEEGEERWANLLELRSVTTRYDDLSPEDALDRLLEETALVADQDSYEGDADAAVADHAPRGEGPRVPGRVHRRPRGGPVPAQPGAR